MKNTMNIASVKLINSGKKGLLVVYSSPYTCKDATSMDALKHTRKFPIHWELEKGFKDLRNVILDVCGYSAETREKDILDTTVNEVIYNSERFSLKGTKTILDTDNEIKLEPKDVNANDYPEYDAAIAILDSIYKETKAYMAGEKEISDEQLVLSFNEGNAEFDSDSFSKLSDVEKRDIATQVLESLGCVVIHAEELVDADSEEEIPETENVIDEKNWVDIEGVSGTKGHDDPAGILLSEPTMSVVKDEIEDDFELPATTTKKEAKLKKASALSLVEGPGDSFKIVAAPAAESTAKKLKIG